MAFGFKNLIPGRRKPGVVAEPDAAASQQIKLVELFENRNLIKRELAQVTAERDMLKAELEALRREHLELQRRLGSLEQVLGDAERGQGAIVYYRLRAVWETCRRQLHLLANELAGKFEKAERDHFQEDRGRNRSQRQQELAQQRDQLEREWRDVSSQLEELQQQLEAAKGIWNRRKRTKLQLQIDKLNRQSRSAENAKSELQAAMGTLQNQNAPAWPGLSVASRRSVNLWLIALAQYLYLQFAEHGIAEKARSAGTQSIADMQFGLPSDCLAIGNHIYEVVVKLRNDKQRPETLRRRAEYLRSAVTYASDRDTVPEESSLQYIPPASREAPTAKDPKAGAVAMNVLGMNYWDIQNILLMPAAPAAATGSKPVAAGEAPLTGSG
ncbi:MAG: hypothetical protein KGJ18_04475 [Gammaproteobacteria bacterium]|nr:hypothetical protein [Gammaproteobacteria bacterium]